MIPGGRNPTKRPSLPAEWCLCLLHLVWQPLTFAEILLGLRSIMQCVLAHNVLVFVSLFLLVRRLNELCVFLPILGFFLAILFFMDYVLK